MPWINFLSPADFYPPRSFGRKSPLRYRRFDTFAEAIRHTVETASHSSLLGVVIECDEQRYQGEEIHTLYLSKAYPLPRAEVAA